MALAVDRQPMSYTRQLAWQFFTLQKSAGKAKPAKTLIISWAFPFYSGQNKHFVKSLDRPLFRRSIDGIADASYCLLVRWSCLSPEPCIQSCFDLFEKLGAFGDSVARA